METLTVQSESYLLGGVLCCPWGSEPQTVRGEIGQTPPVNEATKYAWPVDLPTLKRV